MVSYCFFFCFIFLKFLSWCISAPDRVVKETETTKKQYNKHKSSNKTVGGDYVSGGEKEPGFKSLLGNCFFFFSYLSFFYSIFLSSASFSIFDWLADRSIDLFIDSVYQKTEDGKEQRNKRRKRE